MRLFALKKFYILFVVVRVFVNANETITRKNATFDEVWGEIIRIFLRG